MRKAGYYIFLTAHPPEQLQQMLLQSPDIEHHPPSHTRATAMWTTRNIGRF